MEVADRGDIVLLSSAFSSSHLLLFRATVLLLELEVALRCLAFIAFSCFQVHKLHLDCAVHHTLKTEFRG